ncbi:hypothetical protein G9A89_004996 [Geosiphon pyriformis]|nr:hypothetical protein G9A89_004996 [Geosiphon pyriformis]
MTSSSAISTYSAVVIGATGAVGSALTRELLSSPRCTSVTALNRRSIDPTFYLSPPNSPSSESLSLTPDLSKLQQHIINLDEINTPTTQSLIAPHDVAFCTVGVGQPTKEKYEYVHKIEVENATEFAKACKDAAGSRIKHISLLSGQGASENSRISLLKLKAEVEKNYEDVGIRRTSFFQPSVMITKTMRYGAVDIFNQFVFPKISVLAPQRWREIAVWDLGRAMRINAEINLDKNKDLNENVIERLGWKEFHELLDLEKETIGKDKKCSRK